MFGNMQPTSYRISVFKDWDEKGILELKPTYQRNLVWSHNNKSFLIDSILSGFPVPEIYVQVSTDQHGFTKYYVVDGQQRVTAILDFFKGKYEILPSESQEFGGKKFEDLTPGQKEKFWDYSLVTRELKTSSEEDVRAVFRRLNKYVVPLNKQELRNATYSGVFLKLMSDLADNEFWTENKIMTPKEVRRMKDVEYVSELTLFMIHGVQGKSDDVLNKYYQMYDESFEQGTEIKKRFEKALNKIEEIFPDFRSTRWHYKEDFLSLFLAVDLLLKTTHLPTEKYPEIQSTLKEFSEKVDEFIRYVESEAGEEKQDEIIKKFSLSVMEHTTAKAQRTDRTDAVIELLKPFVTPKVN